MKILNLYAGLGGNRKLWTNVEVTAVEINLGITGMFQTQSLWAILCNKSAWNPG